MERKSFLLGNHSPFYAKAKYSKVKAPLHMMMRPNYRGKPSIFQEAQQAIPLLTSLASDCIPFSCCPTNCPFCIKLNLN